MTDAPTRSEPPARSGLSYRQAVEGALKVLDGQWVVAVLTALAGGPLHSNELLNAINDVDEQVGRHTHDVPLSRQVFAQTLRRMAAAGLVVRVEEPGPHRSVWYRLTPTGRTLLSALRPLAEWAQRYRPDQPFGTGTDEGAPAAGAAGVSGRAMQDRSAT